MKKFMHAHLEGAHPCNAYDYKTDGRKNVPGHDASALVIAVRFAPLNTKC
jgi:hypothetical protein